MATERVGTAAVLGKDTAPPPSVHLACDGRRAETILLGRPRASPVKTATGIHMPTFDSD